MRLSFLIEEREATRQKLGKLNSDKKALNKAINRKLEFCHAFLAAAERDMPEEQFIALENESNGNAVHINRNLQRPPITA